LAWVSERTQGSATRPILTACELEKTTLTDDPIHPSIPSVSQVVSASCSQIKEYDFELANIGIDAISSIRYNVTVGDATQEYDWTGELPSGDKTHIIFEMEIPFGTFTGTLTITEVNGEAYEYSANFTAECTEWAEIEEVGDFTNIKIYIVQDQWGEQITWDLINSAGEIVANGGPYQHLVGSGSTNINVENVTNIPTGECYLFRIYDSNNNGICCNYGNGYYYIKDAHGNRFIGNESNGSYGAGASELFSIRRNDDGIEETMSNSISIYPNPANSKIFVDGENIGVVEVYNSLGQKVNTVEGSEHTSVDMTSFDNGVYVVRVITNEGNVRTQKVTIAH
jgi:hypothetical protein